MKKKTIKREIRISHFSRKNYSLISRSHLLCAIELLYSFSYPKTLSFERFQSTNATRYRRCWRTKMWSRCWQPTSNSHDSAIFATLPGLATDCSINNSEHTCRQIKSGNSWANIMDTIICISGNATPKLMATRILTDIIVYATNTTNTICQTPSAITRRDSILNRVSADKAVPMGKDMMQKVAQKNSMA